MTRKDISMQNFSDGYNCSQAVLLAFKDELKERCGMDETTIKKLASSFGGGMGRMREVCGTVSGMFMVAGLLYGYADPSEKGAAEEHYRRIQELAAAFKKENGSIVCKELLGLKPMEKTEPKPEERTEQYYRKRPCKELAGMAAEMMENYMKEHPLS